MKPLPILLASAALAVLCSALTVVLMGPSAPPAAVPATAKPLEADSQNELRELGARVERLTAELSALQGTVASSAPSAARAPEQDLEALVGRLLDERLAAAGPGSGSDPAAAPAAARVETVDGLMQELLKPGLQYEDESAIWGRARESGKLRELVQAFEQRAAARPDDPDAQLDVGNAYLQMVFDSNDGPERGTWAMKADKSFDQALEIEPTHWEARFTKAMSLSFWPPVFGKQAEAIHQFEILIDQQRNGPLEPEYARTYELLGNLYQQTGQQEKAIEVWRSGAQLFPSNTTLLQKAGGPSGG